MYFEHVLVSTRQHIVNDLISNYLLYIIQYPSNYDLALISSMIVRARLRVNVL